VKLGPLVLLPSTSLQTGVTNFDPDRGMITGSFLSSDVPINAHLDQALCRVWAEEKVIDPQPRISRKRIPEILPEGVDALIRMKLPDGIGPSLRHELPVRFAHLRSEQGVVHPSLGGVYV
jgi:hypothetical protein